MPPPAAARGGQDEEERGRGGTRRPNEPACAERLGPARHRSYSRRVEQQAVGSHGIGDILEALRPEVLDGRRQAGTQAANYRLADANTAGVGELLQPRGDVDPIAQDVAVRLDDDVA